MPEQDGLVHPRARRDLTRGGALEALVREERGRHVEYLLLAVLSGHSHVSEHLL